jgi:glycogen(starch) synthase
VSHDLVDDTSDELLNHLRSVNLINHPNDRVKVIYHPEFVSPEQSAVRHGLRPVRARLPHGRLPQLLRTVGYTPLECVARGIPAVTSDLSGFGAYVLRATSRATRTMASFVCPRRYTSFRDSAMKVADYLYDFTQYGRRERISLRNRIESSADRFDWHELVVHYNNAHQLAIERMS